MKPDGLKTGPVILIAALVIAAAAVLIAYVAVKRKGKRE